MSLAHLTDNELVVEMGDRMRRYRLQQNITQSDLARKAGVAVKTVQNLESGEDVRLSTVVAVLRALGKVDAIDGFLPRPRVSPMELVKSGGSERRRARQRKDG